MSGKTHFVVERLHWRPYECPGNWRTGPRARRKAGAFARLPGSERVACFDERDAAEEDCRRREVEARAGANPFAHGASLCYQTSLDEGRLRDWVLDLGLAPPAAGAKGGWRDWWAKHEPRMTDVQKARIWEALDRACFFRVTETVAPVVFMVAARFWHYNDQHYYSLPDGLTAHKAFRTREAAEAYRAEMEGHSRDDPDWCPFGLEALDDWGAWSSMPEEEALARVKALGLPLPTLDDNGFPEWLEWWYATEMDADQKNAVWDLADKIRFWEVIEVEMPDGAVGG